ncbi:hypothetical protein VHEMI01838 [[Torrubiella] hemipterigena]|uniref:Uncharacterized protein n=1 Tax=[Torrubiella] hemipterigena TaxID=1531966 RepID=A0A0A1T8P7_9HYPO|nr:hypothetical protein VHEMI01838 [[Torrubiella] hemipterigena]
MTAEVSHGRGGAGNINPDETKYVDGEVVRTGVEGSHGDGAYSSGRGGAGNIGDVGAPATQRKDRDLIPDVATRPSCDKQDFHTGRGGAGNEHSAHDHKNGNGHGKEAEVAAATVDTKKLESPTSLADKLKHKLFGALKA